ncbi:hypothetical protein JQ580_28875 [Bradyrhizobium japonicum]|uniref:hypothetical protein n=1 Tax=Bradyrhizobium japonicum TaxID=375 RepID=UPI001BACC6EA|nr:hypothetical protein [Bradyrhizobium japonicum]MBR0994730.1 hypothetical protein [Bradyrhizobium japonicum]
MQIISRESMSLPLTAAKFVLSFVCLAVLASHTVTMLRWSEARGVYDDVCYLRQAHLFQRFGFNGFNTDVTMDDDQHFVSRLQEIGFPDPESPKRWPCHVEKSGGKIVLQYPPGTGFLLAAFPQGFQVTPLYITASSIVCGFALVGIFMAKELPPVIGAGLFGALTVYGMINPGKASYSVAPTLVLCGILGFLTALWLTRTRQSPWLIGIIGVLLGVSVNFRLANILLAAGYCVFLAVTFLRSRTLAKFLDGFGFGVGVAIGMLPTLIAQAINAGSPFATTYGATDAVGPGFSVTVLGQYLRDTQSLLIALVIGWTLWLLRAVGGSARQIGILVAGNLLINLGFFLSHPIFTPYYAVPIAMLSMWTLSFARLMRPREETARLSSDAEGFCSASAK